MVRSMNCICPYGIHCICTESLHFAWYGSTLRSVFDDGIDTIGRRPTESHDCIHGNENMCQVIASRDRYPLG